MTYTSAARELTLAVHHLRNARAALYQNRYEYHREVSKLVEDSFDLAQEVRWRSRSEKSAKEGELILDLDEFDKKRRMQQIWLGKDEKRSDFREKL